MRTLCVFYRLLVASPPAAQNKRSSSNNNCSGEYECRYRHPYNSNAWKALFISIFDTTYIHIQIILRSRDAVIAFVRKVMWSVCLSLNMITHLYTYTKNTKVQRHGNCLRQKGYVIGLFVPKHDYSLLVNKDVQKQLWINLHIILETVGLGTRKMVQVGSRNFFYNIFNCFAWRNKLGLHRGALFIVCKISRAVT